MNIFDKIQLEGGGAFTAFGCELRGISSATAYKYLLILYTLPVHSQ